MMPCGVKEEDGGLFGVVHWWLSYKNIGSLTLSQGQGVPIDLLGSAQVQ